MADRGRTPDLHTAMEASTNQSTLDHALGNLGGRPKAWMASNQIPSHQHPKSPPLASKCYKPIMPRTLSSIPPQAQQQGLWSSTVELSRESYPASSSTSPQLANVVSVQHNGHASPSNNTVLPSPSPSEEAHLNTLASSAGTSNGNIRTPNAANLGMDYSNDAQHTSRNTSLEHVFVDQVRQTELWLKRPTTGAPPRVDKRSRVVGSDQEGQLVTADTAGQVGLSNPQNLVYPEFPRRSSMGHGQIVSAVGQVQPRSPFPNMHPHDQLSPQLPCEPSVVQGRVMGPVDQAQSASPSLNGHLHNQSSSQPGPLRTQSHPHPNTSVDRTLPPTPNSFGPPWAPPQGQVSQPSGPPLEESPINRSEVQPPIQQQEPNQEKWYTPETCVAALQHFHSTHVISPHHPRDGHRLALLQEAVDKQDWAYLTMHQHYCLLDASPQTLPERFREHPNLSHALQLMCAVFDGNASLSPNALHFFANFPMPLSKIAKNWEARYLEESKLFLAFIKASPRFNEAVDSCNQRRYPLLVRELFYDFGIESTIFRRLVFTMILRRIFRSMLPHRSLMSQFEPQAIHLFTENQKEFESQAPRHTAHPAGLTTRERQLEIQNWGSKVKQLGEDFERELTKSGPMTLVQTQVPQVSPQAGHTRDGPLSNVIPVPSMTQRSAQVAPSPPTQGDLQGRFRANPTQTQTQTQIQDVLHSQPAQEQHQRPAPLLPSAGVRQSPQPQPQPARYSLHQANLRSPLLRAQAPQSKLYQYMNGFVINPTRLTEGWRKLEKWTFHVTELDWNRIPKDAPSIPGAPCNRLVDEGNQIIRLRCIKWPSTELPTDHIWAISDTSWLPYAYFTLNGKHLHPRRKLYHGNDLPIDISALIQQGANHLEVGVLCQAGDPTYLEYLLAIETVGIISYDAIKNVCRNERHVPITQTVQSIQRKLSAAIDNETAIVESKLTINLFNPSVASKICDIPARSKACLHYDCFDLDTFLQTRPRKGDASVLDRWQCPICNADARPQYLIIDGFLEDVRQKLLEQHLGEMRAIVVYQDGSWKPKAETRDPNGVQDRGSPEDGYAQAATPAPPVPVARPHPTPIDREVIELSD